MIVQTGARIVAPLPDEDRLLLAVCHHAPPPTLLAGAGSRPPQRGGPRVKRPKSQSPRTTQRAQRRRRDPLVGPQRGSDSGPPKIPNEIGALRRCGAGSPARIGISSVLRKATTAD